MPWHITSFYQFTPQTSSEIAARKGQLEAGLEGMLGLILLAPEGINGTVAGTQEQIQSFKQIVGGDLHYKDSTSEEAPFKTARVVVKPEIVGMKRPDIFPEEDENYHLSAREWHEMLSAENPPIVIDTRNWYETKIGVFKGAVDPGITTFSQWGEFADTADLPKDQPVLIYCTGGIRCEKVMVDLRARGLEKVYQLRDGILGYLAEYPDGLFEGECFVFDDRVAVDAQLKPTERYGLCPGCGAPEEPRSICRWCKGPSTVCPKCEADWDEACSKTCRDRIRRHLA